MDTATFAAGCFWGVEDAFRKMPGVVSTSVGFMGGHTSRPSYEDVCTDRTGHAEVCQVEFDPAIVSYDELLDAFWSMHDPTQVNRQGPDHGSQYRSVVFFHSEEQERAARASKQRLAESGRVRGVIATAIEPAAPYWLAEDYHQQYFEKRGGGVCHVP